MYSNECMYRGIIPWWVYCDECFVVVFRYECTVVVCQDVCNLVVYHNEYTIMSVPWLCTVKSEAWYLSEGCLQTWSWSLTSCASMVATARANPSPTWLPPASSNAQKRYSALTCQHNIYLLESCLTCHWIYLQEILHYQSQEMGYPIGFTYLARY